MAASTGVNPVLSTGYDVAGHVSGVTLGTYDSDAFTFDPNTGRMTQYKHTVGATPQSVIGNLTWNANGTLAALGITDPFNAADQQTCNYGYDDLARISSANCGSPWSQTFGFDPFGNLTKSGSVSFQPQYNTATNRMQSLPGFTPTYDANGNTLTDSLHTYTWDVQGHVTAVDTVGLTYDALGRMVEQNRSGSTSGPTLSYFRHPDWLGSSRFASTPSRTMYSDLAYAPFGETYAEAGTVDRSFTGQNQDTIQGSTTGLYDFLFREYAQYGRWISPDPAGLGVVDSTNPQTWNRYAYVLNNPLSNVDPLGLYLNVIKPDADTLKWIGCRVFGFGCANLVRRCPWCTVFEWDDEKDCGPGNGPCGASQNPPSGLAPQPVALTLSSPLFGRDRQVLLCEGSGGPPSRYGYCGYFCENANVKGTESVGMGPIRAGCGPVLNCPRNIQLDVPMFYVFGFGIQVGGAKVSNCVP